MIFFAEKRCKGTTKFLIVQIFGQLFFKKFYKVFQNKNANSLFSAICIFYQHKKFSKMKIC